MEIDKNICVEPREITVFKMIVNIDRQNPQTLNPIFRRANKCLSSQTIDVQLFGRFWDTLKNGWITLWDVFLLRRGVPKSGFQTPPMVTGPPCLLIQCSIRLINHSAN